MQNLQSVVNARALTPQEKLKLLQLQDLALELEQEERRRKSEEMETVAGGGHTISLEQRHQAFIAARPLKSFVPEGFQVVEPSRQFEDNWHIDIICELLTAVILGFVRNFIINQPRRTMKSLLTCVLFPAWVWTFLPHLRFLFTSYSKGFAIRDNRKTQDLIKSDYYQRRYGHQFRLMTERGDKITNNKGGFRVVFRIGKGVGEGGDFVFADDPNDIEEVESDNQLDKTNKGWSEISSQNVADRRTAARGIVQQRTAPLDLTGYILENEELKNLYTARLTLAARFESDNEDANTPENPLYLGTVTEYDKAAYPELVIGEPKLWIDPRQIGAEEFDNLWYKLWYKREFAARGLKSMGDGQLLWESYIGEQDLKTDEAHLGIYGTSSQLQQRPVMRGGNFFKMENFLKDGKAIPLESVDFSEGWHFTRYWDKAGTEGGGDSTVGLLFARTIKKPYRCLIVDVKTEHMGYHDRQELIRTTAEDDFEQFVEPYEMNEYVVAIEREGASSGKDLATLEREELVGFDVIIDRPKKKKGIRAKPVRSYSESGRIKVVAAPWNQLFFRRLVKFKPDRDSQKDDEVDTLSGAFKISIFGNKVGKGFKQGGY